MIKQLVGVALGGALGSLCRFGLTRWLSSQNPYPAFSLGVIVSNLGGCFLIGLLFTRLSTLDPIAKDAWSAFLITGFLGGLTTFSTYSLEMYRMSEGGAWRWVALYFGIHLVAGMAALAAGAAAGKAWLVASA